MTLWYDETHSFGLLRNALRTDLQSFGLSGSQAGFILNWFDPGNAEYLDRVDRWQQFLCLGFSKEIPDFQGLLIRDYLGRVSLFLSDGYSVRMIHTIARLFYKYHGTPRRETDFKAVATRLSMPSLATMDPVDEEGIRQCLSGITPPDLGAVVGRFGPGATYEGYKSYEKWSRQGLIPDVPASLYRCSVRDSWAPVACDPEGCTRITEVPKSIKCNRIVSSEPAMRMYAQLAVNDDVVGQFHMKFCGHVCLNDQHKHNRYLLYPRACSIDLSDASDHLRMDVVARLLPQLWPVLAKVRSQYTLLPDGELLKLSTFAPMGSGVCFSVMTLVILGICEYARKNYVADHPGTRLWYSVYGDDIIVPMELYPFVVSLLVSAGFVPNVAKCCPNGLYRESCGCEMLGVLDVSSIYIRDPLDHLPADAVEEICSRLEDRAFPATAACVAENASSVRWVRYNRDLQRLEVCVRTLASRQKLRHLDGWSGLNRWFSRRTQGKTWYGKEPGVVQEVWTKPAWRLRACWDYPYLTHWFVTSASCTNHGVIQPR
jgi:hypothetical protein